MGCQLRPIITYRKEVKMRTISGLLVIFFLVTLFGQGSGLAQSEPGALLESEHFTIYFQNEPNPEVRQEIVNFYEQVASTLEEKFSGKIKDKIQLNLGPSYGAFNPSHVSERTAYQYYDPPKPLYSFTCHEALHIILRDLLGTPSDRLFSFLGLERPAPFVLEEVAVRAFDFHFARPSRPIHLYAALIIKEKGFSIEEVLSKGQGYYLPMASFLLFLLEHYDWENFAKLWKYQPDPGKSVLESTEEAVCYAYGQELTALESQWKDQLEALEISPQWRETVQVTLDMRKLYAEKQREWGQAQSKSPGNINISPSELPALYSPLNEVLGSAPDDILIEPFPDLKKAQQALKDFEKFSEIATEAINLTQLAQNSARLGKSEDAYRYFFKLRQSLVALGNTSYLPWVDQNLEELKGKVPPELVRSLEGKAFPWWGWALIGCGAAGVLGLGGWFFVFKRRAHQKGTGQQP